MPLDVARSVHVEPNRKLVYESVAIGLRAADCPIERVPERAAREVLVSILGSERMDRMSSYCEQLRARIADKRRQLEEIESANLFPIRGSVNAAAISGAGASPADRSRRRTFD